jgi:hypothetical protein
MAFALGVVVGLLATFGPTLTAQQQALSRLPSVITSNGFIVEEVRVGNSCVVVVARGGSPSGSLAALPCND